MSTYAYTEYHFRCERCGLNTAGRVVENSQGVGWPTRREARAALRQHERECESDQAIDEVIDLRGSVLMRLGEL
jgi:hypothetical protein